MRQSGVRPDPCRINAAFRPMAALNLGGVPGCAPSPLAEGIRPTALPASPKAELPGQWNRSWRHRRLGFPLVFPWIRGGSYHACTTHVPGLHLACTSHVPGLYLALGGVALPFCILHSSFYLRSGVALGSHWGRNRLAINTLWGGFDVALRSH
jgi:hypothetical protein